MATKPDQPAQEPEITVSVPAMVPKGTFTKPKPDMNRGKGGSYQRDPATGERVLVERTGFRR